MHISICSLGTPIYMFHRPVKPPHAPNQIHLWCQTSLPGLMVPLISPGGTSEAPRYLTTQPIHAVIAAIFQFLNNSHFFLRYPFSSFSSFCSLQCQHPPWSANTLMVLQQLDSSLNHSLPTLSSSCPYNTPFKPSARWTFSKNQIWSFHFLTYTIFLRASKAFHKLYITLGFVSCQPPWVACNTAKAFTIPREAGVLAPRSVQVLALLRTPFCACLPITPVHWRGKRSLT